MKKQGLLERYRYRFLVRIFRMLGWSPEKIKFFFNYRDTSKQLPSVSVIIPNYNYENYLEERIASILGQTILPYEIIFLDDCSTDQSVEVATELLKNSKVPYQIISQSENKGCFGQWLEGIEKATGDVIWIAEADDKCELNFLEKLLPSFRDEDVSLAYAQSHIIDGNGKKSGWSYLSYTKDIDKRKWKKNYIRLGQDEISDSLAIKNTIPNASAVLMKKSALYGLEEKLLQFTSAGDWYTYLYILQKGKIFFCSEFLNYHRRHEKSIIHKTIQNLTLYEEVCAIQRYLLIECKLPAPTVDALHAHWKNEYVRVLSECKAIEHSKEVTQNLEHQLQELEELSIVAKDAAKKRKSLLILTFAFSTGGGEVFPIRLANFLSNEHNVFIYTVRPISNLSFIKDSVSKNVRILTSLGLKKTEQIIYDVNYYIDKYKIEVINSHSREADIVAYLSALQHPEVKWTMSCHGAYDLLCDKDEKDILFNKYGKIIFDRANSITFAAEKNKKIFNELNLNVSNKLCKIYNGYEKPNVLPKSRKDIAIPEDAFIFGQVSRAIYDKGWEEAIKAFLLLNQERCHLVLIAVGSYMEALKKKYAGQRNIHFITEMSEPQEWLRWVQIFDVGLLPTYFPGESFPTVLVEYLVYKKPVISTDFAEIPQMIEYEGKKAGLLVPYDSNGISVEELRKAMETLYLNTELYQEFVKNTEIVSQQFSMEQCGEKYLAAYLGNRS